MIDNEPMESTEEDVTRVRLPNIKENEMFGIADQLLGASKIRVMCEDGQYAELYGMLSPQVRKQLAFRGKYWDKYRETVTAKASSAINDTYLKANNQTDGEKSYGRVVDLMIADYLQRHGSV